MEDLLKQLAEGGDPGELDAMVIGGDESEGEQEEELPPLAENDLVEVTGNADPEGKEKLVLRGRIRGLAPIHTPFGIAGVDYIIELEDPSKLPMSGDEPYAYSCITAPRGVIALVEETGTDSAE